LFHPILSLILIKKKRLLMYSQIIRKFEMVKAWEEKLKIRQEGGDKVD